MDLCYGIMLGVSKRNQPVVVPDERCDQRKIKQTKLSSFAPKSSLFALNTARQRRRSLSLLFFTCFTCIFTLAAFSSQSERTFYAYGSPSPAGSWAAIFTSTMAHSSSTYTNHNGTPQHNTNASNDNAEGPNDARIAQLHRIALAYRSLNPRREHLRYFVGYPCTADEPFKCLFSHCMSNTTGTCGCQTEADEALFLGLFCLPTRALGQTCVAHEQCSQKVTGSECARFASQTEVGHCICAKGYFLDPSPANDENAKSGEARCVRNEAAMVSSTGNENKNTFVDLLSEPGDLKNYFMLKDFERRRRQQHRHRCETDGNCMQNGMCNLSSGECECRSGFQLSENKRECVDIDECSMRFTADGRDFSACLGTIGYAQCINTIGSYECRCVGNATKGRLGGMSPDGVCCGAHEIPCDIEPQCVRIDRVCDGFADCSNAYDEMFSFCFPNVNNTIPSKINNSSVDDSDEARHMFMTLTVATTERSTSPSHRHRTLPSNLVLAASATPPPMRRYHQPIRFEGDEEWTNNRLHFPLDKGASSFPHNFHHKTSFFKLEPTLTGRLNLMPLDFASLSNNTLPIEPTFTTTTPRIPTAILSTAHANPDQSQLEDENMDQLFLDPKTFNLLKNQNPTKVSENNNNDRWPSSPTLAQSVQPPTNVPASLVTSTARLSSPAVLALPSSTTLSAKLRVLPSLTDSLDTNGTTFLHNSGETLLPREENRALRRSKSNYHYLGPFPGDPKPHSDLLYRKDLGIWVVSPQSKNGQTFHHRFKRQIMRSFHESVDRNYPSPTTVHTAPHINQNFPFSTDRNQYQFSPGSKSYPLTSPSPSFDTSSSQHNERTRQTRRGCSTQPNCKLWKWYAFVKRSAANRKTKALLPPPTTSSVVNYVPPPPPVADFYTSIENPQFLRTDWRPDTTSAAQRPSSTESSRPIKDSSTDSGGNYPRVYGNNDKTRPQPAGEIPAESYAPLQVKPLAAEFKSNGDSGGYGGRESSGGRFGLKTAQKSAPPVTSHIFSSMGYAGPHGELPEDFVEQQARQVATDFAKANNFPGAENYYDTLFNDEQSQQPAQRSFFADRQKSLNGSLQEFAQQNQTTVRVSSELPQRLRENITTFPAVTTVADRNELVVGKNMGNHYMNSNHWPNELTTFRVKRRFGKSKLHQ